MKSDGPATSFGVFRIIGASVRLFLANIQQLFLYGFVPLLALGLLSMLLVNEQVFAPSPTTGLQDILTPGLAVVGIVNVVVAALVNATLIMLSYDAAVGDRSTLSQYFSHGMKNIIPIVVLSLVFGVMVSLGLVLLVAPGLFIIAVFYIYAQTILIDGAGWRGLHASAALTKGYRWPVLGTIIICGLIMLTPGLLFQTLAGPGGPAAMAPLLIVLVTAAINSLSYGFSAVFSTRIYLRLTELKRGGSRGDLTDIFR